MCRARTPSTGNPEMRHIQFIDGPAEGMRDDFQFDLEIRSRINIRGPSTNGITKYVYEVFEPGRAKLIVHESPCQ